MTATVQDMATQKPLTVWYDGADKAIVQEIEQIKSKDKQGRLDFVDASAAGFKPEGELGSDAVRKQVHVRKADGVIAKGVAALEAAYEAVGLGSWFRFCRKPGLEAGRLFAPQAAELKKAA